MIKILLADDHALVRDGIRRVIDEVAEFRVVAETGSGSEVIALADTHQPDVAVLDITMPGRTGLELTPELKASGIAVLILSMHDHPRYAIEAVRAGADGYVLKDSGPAELREAIADAAAGKSHFQPVAAQLGGALKSNSHNPAALTPREEEVLSHVAAGLTNKQIAAQLRISPRTVEAHRESLMEKLDIRTVAGLTRYALQNGLID